MSTTPGGDDTGHGSSGDLPPGWVPPPSPPPPGAPTWPQAPVEQAWSQAPGSGYAPGYGYGYGAPMPVDHPQGTTILVLGILGLVTCPILAVVAWVMGNGALREIDAAPGRYANRGNVAAGRMCGIVGTCLSVAILAFYLFIVVVLVGVGSTSSG